MRARMAAHWDMTGSCRDRLPKRRNGGDVSQWGLGLGNVDEGISSFYKGIRPTLMGIMPYAGLSFMAYETLKAHLVADEADVTVHQRLFCGACAGIFAQSTTYPLDIIRRRMQVHPGLYRNELHALRAIYRSEGLVGGLFKGVSMNWIKGPVAVGVRADEDSEEQSPQITGARSHDDSVRSSKLARTVLFYSVAQEASVRLWEFRERDLSITLWAFARVELREEPLMRRIGDEAMKRDFVGKYQVCGTKAKDVDPEEHEAWALRMWRRMDRDNNRYVTRAELDCEEFRQIIRSVLTPNGGATMGGVEYMSDLVHTRTGWWARVGWLIGAGGGGVWDGGMEEASFGRIHSMELDHGIFLHLVGLARSRTM
eukprot:g10699.t1